MAAQLVEDTSRDHVELFTPFLKKEKASDGTLIVYGKMTGPQLDLDQQIVDADWARGAIEEWFKNAANIRQMHSPQLPPAGKGIEIEEKSDGFWLRSKIIEPYAIKAIEEGVYTGYSIGVKQPRIIRDSQGVAKNGRIVGGMIVETSVVDYPCLPSAKFADIEDKMVMKSVTRSDDEPVSYVLDSAITKSSDDDDDDKKKKGDNDADDNGGPSDNDADDKGDKSLDAEYWKRDFSKEQREQAAKDGDALPDGSFPIKNKSDLSNAIHAYGRAKDKTKAKRHIISRAKDLGATDMLPDDWKSDSEDYMVLLKRAHDAICPAYDLSDVLFAHPTLAKDGLASAVGPSVRSALYKMLAEEVTEDGGTGMEAHDIGNAAAAYKHLCEFLLTETVFEGEGATLLTSARAQLRKDFMGGDVMPPTGPKPGQAPKPPMSGSASAPAVPFNSLMPADSMSTPPAVSKPGGSASTSDPAVPGSEGGMPGGSLSLGGDITEGTGHGAADGQQDPSPSPDNHVGKRVRYDNGAGLYDAAAQDQIAASLQNFHDSLRMIDDVSCPMPKAGAADVVDMKAASKPTPVADPAAQVNGDASSVMKTVVEDGPQEPTLPENVLTIEKSQDLINKAVKAATEAVKTVYGETIAKLENALKAKEAEIEKLEAEPDPSQSAIRKAVVPAGRPSYVNDENDERQLNELKEKAAALKMLAENSPDPVVRTYSYMEYEKLSDHIAKMNS